MKQKSISAVRDFKQKPNVMSIIIDWYREHIGIVNTLVS